VATLVFDLAAESRLLRLGVLEGVLVGRIVDLKEEIASVDLLIVLDAKFRDRTFDDRRDADEVGEDLCVISARVDGGEVDCDRDAHESEQHNGCADELTCEGLLSYLRSLHALSHPEEHEPD
jgi:hypothetical protein